MVVIGAVLGAIGRKQARVHRLAIDHHGTGAAIAGVAAFFDAEIAELAQERAQALAGARAGLMVFAVHQKSHAALAPLPPSSGEFLRQIAASHAGASRCAVDVVVIVFVRNLGFQAVAQRCRATAARKTTNGSDAALPPLPSAQTIRRPATAFRSRARPNGRAGSARFGGRLCAGAAPQAAGRCAKQFARLATHYVAAPRQNR